MFAWVFFSKNSCFFLKAFNSISGSHNFHNGCQPTTFAFSWNVFSQCRMWKWLERPAAKMRRTVWCDVSTLFNANKFKYESAWTIQRQIDATKSKIRWGTKFYFHFSSTCCCQHSPGAAEPWSESSCREGDAEAQRSFRWLTIPTAGAVRAVFRTLTGLRVGWLPNITPLGDIISLLPNMEVLFPKEEKTEREWLWYPSSNLVQRRRRNQDRIFDPKDVKASAPLVVRKLQRAFATLSGSRFVRFVDKAGSDLDPGESIEYEEVMAVQDFSFQRH